MLLFQSISLQQIQSGPNPTGLLISVIIDAILEVFFLSLVGYTLARKGIIDDKAKKTLNKINVSLFTPALLFSKVAFTLTPDKLRELVIIPCGFVVLCCVSAAVAFGLSTLFRLKSGQRNFASTLILLPAGLGAANERSANPCGFKSLSSRLRHVSKLEFASDRSNAISHW